MGKNIITKSLYPNDLIPMIALSDFQKESISKLLNDIDNNILKQKINNCLCNNQKSENDIIISEKDRYGIPIKNLICAKCGLIRIEKVFDYESNKPILNTENSYFNEEITHTENEPITINGLEKIKD